MLSTMVALICELCWAATRWWTSAQPGGQVANALAALTFFSALVIGGVALALTPVVLRSRRVLPPRGITFFAVVVGAAPLLTLCWRLFG
jgi:hypothetical protein